MTLAPLLHGFFSFLGTVEGELLKSAIELILFTVVDYMIISEWTRSRKRELKFLIIAFSAMAVDKLASAYFLASVVFTGSSAQFWTLHTADNLFEIFALFLVANAFIYPILIQKKQGAKRFMASKLPLLLGISIVLSGFVWSVIDLRGGALTDFWTNTSINIAQIVVLLYYAGYIIANRQYKLRYKINIMFAFVIYAVTPMIELFNIVFYDNLNRSLAVAAHPFPFISILMFTQVIYLKLADKAMLKSQLKRSEAMYAHEKELSKLKDEFVSTVSHELKTPITSMKLYTGLLREGKLGPVPKKQKDALDVVHDETDRLNRLITDILDLSRLEANKSRLELSEFDLRELVDDKIYLGMAKKEQVSTVIDVPKGFIVTADRNKMKQVFINLFNNAVKFTPAGGTITISAMMRDTEWDLSVEDTGIGVEKDKIPKLFEKFYQAENYMTRKKGGIGLGLSIVKGIVELHEGKIGVESELNKGTKITIVFPKLTRY
jgi:signal transduction histidine kinase